MFGRNSESPVAIVAASTPGDCFDTAIEAVRIATQFMVPTFLLSDGYLANGSEPWKLPDLAKLPDLKVHFRTDPQGYKPYLRNPQTLARPWVKPGTPGLIHRIGGIEKADVTGNISYDPDNHEKMVKLRAEKIERIANFIPELEVHGPKDAKLLVLGWGSTKGAITGAVTRKQADGVKVAMAHLRYLNPFPKNLGAVLKRFDKVLVPEMNLGQLAFLLRGRFLKDVFSFTKVQGRPFTTTDIIAKATELLEA
jgi:2-oxoglutarate ferredoxin oxidoreductase subunit alpha